MILKKIRFKNFFSAGNAFLEIDIQKYNKSVLVGVVGAGKSTIANSITFALFGKTIKSVTKGQICNSINGKNCVVEAEFSANNNEYKIIRGIKPNVFEIYENGVLLDQSSVLDYQAFLEEKILKCSYRTFLQTSVISIENYRPFMSIPKADRREFIEDILDIRVFSTMNQLVKAKVNKNKEELKLLEVSLRSAKEKIILQKSHITKLEEMKKIGIESLDTKLISYQEEIETLKNSLFIHESITDNIERDIVVLKEQTKKRNVINTSIIELKGKINSSNKDITFFTNTSECSTCRQPVAEHHAKSILDNHKCVNDGLTIELDGYLEKLKEYSDIDSRLQELNQKSSSNNGKISVANASITRLNQMISGVNREKSALVDIDDIQEQREAMSEAAKGAMVLRERQLAIMDDQAYNTVMLELFKDTGIKSKIVDQYISTINFLVNQYLEKLDFFVSFNLDSEFNETIKSRHRDEFTYSSFSAGEKTKIDISLLFTFRQLAKMRNSFSTNLLLLDETLDKSITASDIELLMNILDGDEFKETNIMVISHKKELFEECFDGVYEITKRDGFTQISNV